MNLLHCYRSKHIAFAMETYYTTAYGKIYYLLNTEAWNVSILKQAPKVDKIYNKHLIKGELKRISEQENIIKLISSNNY